MKEFLKKTNILMLLLSVVLSVSLWAWVQKTNDPERTTSFTGVSVRFEGERVLRQDTNMHIIEGLDSTINLTLKGKTNAIKSYSLEELYVTADVSGITSPGWHKLSYTVCPLRGGVTVQKKTPQTIDVWVDEIITREVGVSTAVDGAPSEGYVYGNVTADRKTITISGPESIVSEVNYARVTLQADNATADVQGKGRIVFVDAAGNVLDAAHIRVTSGEVGMSLSVSKQKSLPVLAAADDESGLLAELGRVTVTPANLKVVGAPDVIDALTAIDLGKVKLIGFESQTVTVPVVLPEGVTLAEGEPKWVDVRVDLENLYSQKFELEGFAVDPGNNRAGYEVEVPANKLEITVVGRREVVEALEPAAFTVTAKFDADALGEGAHQIPISIAVDADGVMISEAPDKLNVILHPTGEETPAEGEPAS